MHYIDKETSASLMTELREWLYNEFANAASPTVKEIDTRIELCAAHLAGALAQAWPRSGKPHRGRSFGVRTLPTFMAIKVSEKRWPLKRFVIVPHPAMMVEVGHLSKKGNWVPGQNIAKKTALRMMPLLNRIMQTGQM